LSVVGVAGWPMILTGWPAGWCATLSGIEVRVSTHAHVSMITYRADVYRSRPIGASYWLGVVGQEQMLTGTGARV